MSDRAQPALHNLASGGGSWTEQNVTAAEIEARSPPNAASTARSAVAMRLRIAAISFGPAARSTKSTGVTRRIPTARPGSAIPSAPAGSGT